MKGNSNMTLRSAAWRKLVAAFVAVATLLAMVIVSGVASRQIAWADTATASGTLYQYVTSAKLSQRSGNDEDWKEVTATDKLDPSDENLQLQFALGFELPAGTLSKQNPLTYQVPSDIEISGFSEGSDTISGSIDNNGTSMGTYTITKSGLITLTFNDDTVKNNASAPITNGFMKFNSTVQGLTNGDGSSWKFGDDSEITIHLNQSGDLWANKSVVSSNNTDGTVQWKIVVGSEKGTNPDDKVTITDTMTGNAFVAANGFKVTDKNNNDVTAQCGSAPVDGATSFTISCPALGAGDTYTVTYTGKAPSLTDGYTTGKNKASVDTTDKEGNKLHQEPEQTVTWDRTPNPSKSGELQADGRIKWTVKVSTAGSLDGWTLKDIPTGGVTIQDITLTNDGTGSSTKITGFPYTFPEGSAQSYTITYFTTVPTGSLTVKNKATLVPPNTTNGKTNKNSGDISVSYDPVTKAGNASTLAEGSTNRTNNSWTVTIAPPTGMTSIPANWTYTDTFSSKEYFTQYMTAEQQTAVKKAIEDAFSKAGLQSPTITFTTSSITEKNTDQNGKVADGEYVTGFTVTSAEKLEKSIVFSYQTTGIVTGTSNQYYYDNKGQVNDSPTKTAQVTYTPKQPNWSITKTDALDSSKSSTEHAYHELKCQAGQQTTTDIGDTVCNDPYMEWNIKVQQANFSSVNDYTSDLTITETLPENVSLLNGANTDNAGLLLQMKNLYDQPIGDAFPLSIPDDGQTSTTTYQWNPNFWENGIYYSDIPLSFKVSRNGNQLSIVVSKEVLKALNTYVYNKGNLSFSLTVRAGFDSTKLDLTKSWKNAQVFKNTVNLNDGSSKKGTDATQTQTITKNDDWNAVRKSYGQIESNVIPYAVVVNPYGKDLDPSSETVTLVDTMTYTHNSDNNLSVSLRDVKVYRYDKNKKNDDGTACKDSQCIGEEVPLEEYSYQYEHSGDTQRTNTLTFTLPDATPLVVTYNYRYAGKLGNHNGNTIANKASMEGVSSSGTSVKVAVNDTSAGATHNLLRFHKVDEKDYSITLSGVKFALYAWNPEANNGQGDYESACPTTDDGENQYLETDKDGMLLISAKASQSEGSEDSCSGNTASINSNVAYKLVEVEAHSGYEKTDQPYYFMIVDDDTSKWPVKKPKDFESTYEITGIYNDYFTNKKSTAVELPSTGGTGDGWFIGGGLLTVMVASFGLAESLKNAKRSKVSQK
ncbi:SpaA isopeptide-forming pilin-related protein [Bifidobacterium moukalabense]|uniref:SpaA isopeptide-forming pilin-related protein n=1 Tax=Bifidobacterium moukalabense TaxID=1333651 RepID=UPI001358C4E9|nr:hypothetical protein [Bifidobacterium moukalabense]